MPKRVFARATASTLLISVCVFPSLAYSQEIDYEKGYEAAYRRVLKKFEMMETQLVVLSPVS